MAIIGSPQLIDVSGNLDRLYNKSYTRTYLVYSTTDCSEEFVLANLGITVYDRHPDNARALVEDITVSLAYPNRGAYDAATNPGHTSSPEFFAGVPCYVWKADVRYGPWTPFENTSTGDPADQPVYVSIEGQNGEQIAKLDVDGNPILNSAFDYFDPPVNKDEARILLRFRKNFTSFSPSELLFIANKTNSTTWNTFAPKTLKVATPRATMKYSQFTDKVYWEVELDLEYNRDTWKKKIINQGYRELKTIGSDPKQVAITDGQGMPITSPYLLDEDGVALDPPVDSDNIIILEFDIYDPIEFADLLPLPTDLFTS